MFTKHELETILYTLEGYMIGNDDIEAGRLVEEDINKYPIVDEEVTFWEVDYAEEIDIKCQSNNKSNVTYNEVDYVEQCITEGHDYRDCVDTLVGNMVASDNIITHDSEGC